MNILEIKSSKVIKIKRMFDTIKELLPQGANIVFDDKGMKISSVSDDRAALVYLSIAADEFDSYYCANELSVGICLGDISEILQQENDSITLFILSDSPHKLGIKTNSDTNAYFIDTLKLPNDSFHLPPTTCDISLTIDSSEFFHICQSSNGVLEHQYLRVNSVDGQLSIKIKNKNNIAIFCEPSSHNSHNSYNLISDHQFESNYYMECITLFAQALNRHPGPITIYLKKDFPIIIQDRRNIGVLSVALSPGVLK